jgi:hypothetical protein
MNQTDKEYYVSRSIKWVKELDNKMRFFKAVLYRSFSNEEVNEIANQTLRNFMEMLPKIPYVGGDKNPLTDALIVSCWFAALHNALKKQGTHDDEIGEITRTIASEIATYEMKARRKRMALTPSVLRPIVALRPFFQTFGTVASTKKNYKENYLITYMGGPGAEYDWLDNPNQHTVVRLPNNQATDQAFRYTYRVNFHKNGFSGIELIRSEVAVTA